MTNLSNKLGLSRLFTLLAVLAMVFTFSACSDDDDADDPIVSTWKVARVYYVSDTWKDAAANYVNELVMFKNDGTFTGPFIGVTNSMREGTYRLNGNTLALTYANGNATTSFTYTLDGDELVISYEPVKGEPEYRMYYVRQ